MRSRPRGPRSLQQTLAAVHEHFAHTACAASEPDNYRRAHRAGMDAARRCILEELAADAALGSGRTLNPNRHRDIAALAAIVDRLTGALECVGGSPHDLFGIGYRAGVVVASDYILSVSDTYALREPAL